MENEEEPEYIPITKQMFELNDLEMHDVKFPNKVIMFNIMRSVVFATMDVQIWIYK